MTSCIGFLISMFGTRMCGQTLLFIVIANGAKKEKLSIIINISCTQHKLLSLYVATDDLRAFLIIAVTENNPPSGTEEALWVRHTRANKATSGETFCQNTNGGSFSSSVSPGEKNKPLLPVHALFYNLLALTR